ncbi:hypothetical protein HPB50_003282 [Hyalomma asiaticum]|uniref:Uncharacterized protein n=1 Tax=Hyalomma asiaticum TaxID=266040 RepID=A0ACB7TBL5_HYAAI|nr:hypothetical protein HPB50_003282 [Hyalomma asiaticum]
MEKKPADPTNDDAGKANAMFTATFQAAQLFYDDDSWKREFAPAAIAMAMPGLREQRTTRQYCDVVFLGSDGVETWAHRFVMSYSNGGYEFLAEAAYRFVLSNFNQVSRNAAQFLELTPEEMQTILEDRRLHARSEVEDTFQAILKWISADVTRKRYLAKFLTFVRFARCTIGSHGLQNANCFRRYREFESVLIHPEVQTDRDSLSVLNAIHQSLLQPLEEVDDVAGVDMSRKLWLEPRMPKDILFVYGGWTLSATNTMLTYNCRAQTWRTIMGNEYTPPRLARLPEETLRNCYCVIRCRAYHGVAVIDSCIYFVGGFDGNNCYHSLVCFDVPLARWSPKANMAYERCYVSVAVLQASNESRDRHYVVPWLKPSRELSGNSNRQAENRACARGHIYAMGGFDGRRRTNTVERYEIKKNQWYRVSDMNDVRSDASAAAVCGRIYIAGGYTGLIVLDTVECYDPSTDVWTRIATMSSPRSGLKVVAHEEALYIIGGYSGQEPLSSMVEFDVKRARFSELPSLPEARSSFGAAVLEGSIYIIGGFNGMVTVKTVERYDISARKWYTAPRIHTNRSASAACTVENVDNPGPAFEIRLPLPFFKVVVVRRLVIGILQGKNGADTENREIKERKLGPQPPPLGGLNQRRFSDGGQSLEEGFGDQFP